MSILEGLTFAFCASPMTGPTNIAVTTVLFMNAESPLMTDVSTSTRRFSLPVATFSSRDPSASSTPVSCNAPLRTKIDASMMMMSLLKPANASRADNTPVPIRTSSRINVLKSTGTFSRENSSTATSNRARTTAICQLAGNVMARRKSILEHYAEPGRTLARRTLLEREPTR